MISKRLRGSLDSSICIRDIFEEGKKMAAIYGSENIFNFTIGNPSDKRNSGYRKTAGTAWLSGKCGTSGSAQTYRKLFKWKI